MTETLFTNCLLLDPHAGASKPGYSVLVRDRLIVEVAKGLATPKGAGVVDCGGRTLMPGLVDCHLHIISRGVYSAYRVMPPSLIAAHAADVLKGILMRGFTTARDAGGADSGHRQAIERGYLVGPRLFVCGRVISQTGGHGDVRNPADLLPLPRELVHLFNGGARLADGVAGVRKAVRDEIRLGCDAIKIMAGGGVTSKADPLDQMQYTEAELAAAAEEANRAGRYVLAHVYTAPAIKRCIEAGIRSIEHGNLIDEDGARMMARAGAYLVPTLIAYRALKTHAAALKLTPEQVQKLDFVMEVGGRSIEIAARAGVPMAYGTDCFFTGEAYQSDEFAVRGEFQKPADVIRSATLVGAEVVGLKGRIGEIAPGFFADLLVVDGDPLTDLGLLRGEGQHLSAIMKDGRLYKNRLAPTAVDVPPPGRALAAEARPPVAPASSRP